MIGENYIQPNINDDSDKQGGVKEKKNIVLMTGTQMERPLRHLAGLIKEYSSGEYEVDILNLGTRAGIYDHRDGGYPEELKQEIIAFLIEKKPSLLGVTMIDFGHERISQLIKEISQNGDIKSGGMKILAGGKFAMEHPERCLNTDGIDVVCYAKGWHFCDIVKACEEGGLESVPGLMIKTGINEDGKATYIKTETTAEVLTAKLQDQPVPDESLENSYMIYKGRLVNIANSGGALPVEHHQFPYKHTGVLVLSEGCPNDCNFCSISTEYEQTKKLAQDLDGQDVKVIKFDALTGYKPMEYLKNYLKENPNTDYFLFNDNDFFGRNSVAIDYFSQQYAEKIGLPFYCQGSPNTVKRDKIESLVHAGLDTLDIGVQGSQESNKSGDYNRKTCTDEQVLAVIDYVSPFVERRDPTGTVVQDGIKLALDFINGNEIHTREDMLSTFELIRKINGEMDKCTGGQGSWNLAIHNLTLDAERELAVEYRKKKEAEGVSVGEVEDSDYHNASIESFYKLKEPYLNIVLEWMGGLHGPVSLGKLPRSSKMFLELIGDVLERDETLKSILSEVSVVKMETVDLLTDDKVYEYLGGVDNMKAKELLKLINEKIPEIYYSYQRPDRYDFDYSWAEKQIAEK